MCLSIALFITFLINLSEGALNSSAVSDRALTLKKEAVTSEDTAKAIYNDASVFNDIMMELSAISQELTSSMTTIAANVNSVSQASEQEAEQIEKILAMTESVKSSTDVLDHGVRANKESVVQLEATMSRFKI